MSGKRKDSKGRCLKNGERQRPDGSYEFRYCGLNGRRYSVYSWRLVPTDTTPKGKKEGLPLREIEKDIMRSRLNGTPTSNESLMLDEYFDIYIANKKEARDSTLYRYAMAYNANIRNTNLGTKTLRDIRYDDIKNLYNTLHYEYNRKYKSISYINGILSGLFKKAIRNRYIEHNPCDGVMAEIRKQYDNPTPRRAALTKKQQSDFVRYCAESKQYEQYLPLITIMLGTGCRIGELLALTWSDCNFERGLIEVSKTVSIKMKEDGLSRIGITPPKTPSGNRSIPMLSPVRDALLMLKGRNQNTKLIIDGKSGFIFTTKSGKLPFAQNIDAAIRGIVVEHNKKYPDNKLPHISPHILRHTFCTRLCECETNLKLIQYIMGHSDIRTTMNIYNSMLDDAKIEAFHNLDNGKMMVI